jgi:bacillithiol disulfide reductase
VDDIAAAAGTAEAARPKDVLIVGAGPAGLAVAIAAAGAGLEYEVLEKGVLVNSVYHFPRNMIFFTTAELLEIGGLPFVTPFEKPTQAEGLKYYRRVADAYGLRIAMDEEVAAIRPEGPAGAPSFVVESRWRGEPRARRARNVVMATGYYDHPNLLGVPGEDLPHVSHYYREAHACYRRNVVVVGGKNSAAIVALELYRAGAEVTLVHRGAELGASVKYWIRPDIDNRIKEGSITARFFTRVLEIRPDRVTVEGPRGRDEIEAEAVFLLTGYHPDPRLLTGAGVRVDEPTLVPEHDRQTLETNVPGLYLAGAIVSGRETGRIFIENGRFHGQAIVSAIRARRQP